METDQGSEVSDVNVHRSDLSDCRRDRSGQPSGLPGRSVPVVAMGAYDWHR